MLRVYRRGGKEVQPPMTVMQIFQLSSLARLFLFLALEPSGGQQRPRDPDTVGRGSPGRFLLAESGFALREICKITGKGSTDSLAARDPE